MLQNKNVLLGVTGSIAAYKAVDIARRLKESGAVVTVVMTEAACRFVTPYLFEAVSGNPVHHDLFQDTFSHINLARDADLFLIAPATANTINKLSCGIADNLLSTLWLAYEGPALMAPAMNFRMYRNQLVQKHIKGLHKSGVLFAGPASGALACGEEGVGRMVDVTEIVEAAHSALTAKDLKGLNILVTAGPTEEPIDPVRFISNRSSGKMGYAIARAARRRGADVTLISGPSALTPPEGVSFISVTNSSEMETQVFRSLKKATAVVMAAAVADYGAADKSKVKLKKTEAMTLKLNKTPDILSRLGRMKDKRILIGFAAETGRDIKNAKNKLKAKNLDLIVLNDISQNGAGFDVDTNVVTLINKEGETEAYPLMPKIEVADLILDKLPALTSAKKS